MEEKILDALPFHHSKHARLHHAFIRKDFTHQLPLGAWSFQFGLVSHSTINA
jgi:hypothetical protein